MESFLKKDGNRIEERLGRIESKIEKLDERLTNFLEIQRMEKEDLILDRSDERIVNIEEKLWEQEKNNELLLNRISILQKKMIELKEAFEKSLPDKKILEKL